jgi:hypothetical protein
VSRTRSLSTALAVMLFAAPLAAQGEGPIVTSPESVTVTGSVAAPVAVSAGPTITNATAGIRTSASVVSAPTGAPPQEGRVGRNPAMMIVGGVALIAGAVIGGDTGTIIMVGGAAIGLYGLWQYLK